MARATSQALADLSEMLVTISQSVPADKAREAEECAIAAAETTLGRRITKKERKQLDDYVFTCSI